MVEKNLYLDNLFGSLANPIRRDILHRLSSARQTVGQLAKEYDISLAAVAKHLKVLENARLISKTRKGNRQIVSIAPSALKDASRYLQQYEKTWNTRFDTIDSLIKE